MNFSRVSTAPIPGLRQSPSWHDKEHQQKRMLCPSHPIFNYQNVAAALKFLAKAFGFRKYGVPMRRPDGKIHHAAMKLGDDLIMMGCPGPEYKNPKRLGEATQSLYVNVKDLDAHFQRARRTGTTILEEPKDTPYGHRRYGPEDPEGHQWHFAEDIPKSSKPRRPRRSSS
jgi:uncharacterized glyoxalase superfamily protein PhnB